MTGANITPASALPNLELPHWSNFRFVGSGCPTPTSCAFRSFYLSDRSGDDTVHAALQQLIQDYQNDLNARGAWGYVPAISLLREDQYAGQCDSTAFSAGSGFQSLGSGYSFATVCSGGQGSGTSVTWSGGSHAAQSYHPSIHIEREYADYNTTYSSLNHELLHVLGVGHTSDCTDLMGGVEYGCRLKVGVLKKPSGADYDALTNFYGRNGQFYHPVFG